MQPLSDALSADRIVLSIPARTLPDGVRAIMTELTGRNAVSSAQAKTLESALLAREQLGATCIGRGVVIPHAYPKGISSQLVALGRLEQPIGYDAPDGKPVDLIFVLSGPPSAQPNHLPFLAHLVRLLHHDDVLDGLRGATTQQEMLQTLQDAEQRHA